jgi:type II secretory pathway pseudopilin PulG
MPHADRRGTVLLEALIALALLGIVGGSVATLVSETMHTVAHVHEAEAHLRNAARFLTAVTLWPRTDLDRHLGTSQQGVWLLRVDRPNTTLYEVTLTEATTGTVLLRTALFRPGPER